MMAYSSGFLNAPNYDAFIFLSQRRGDDFSPPKRINEACGAAVHRADTEGQSALLYAWGRGHTAVAELLQKAGAKAVAVQETASPKSENSAVGPDAAVMAGVPYRPQ